MKKLLLGLGTLSLISLPALTVISCTSTEETPTLETEKAKFKTAVTLLTDVEPTVAALEINNATGFDAKKTALNLYYETPVLATGFSYIIENASASPDLSSNLDVIITVFDEKNNHTEYVTLKITGFKTNPTPIDFQKELDTIIDTTTTINITAKKVFDEINSAGNDITAKSAIIKKYMNLNLSSGFEVVYDNVIILNPTALSIKFHLTKDGKSSNTKTIMVSGFQAESIVEFDYIIIDDSITINGFKAGIATTSLIIPSKMEVEGAEYEVTKINSGAFADKKLTSLNVPITIIEIGNNAFSNNLFTSSTSVKLPPLFNTKEERTRIGIPDFTNEFKFSIINGNSITITGLQYWSTSTSLIIPSKMEVEGAEYPVTTIDDTAFLDGELTSLTIPDTITTIGWRAFAKNWLSSLTFGAGSTLTEIGDGAFGENQFKKTDSITNLPSSFNNPADKYRIEIPNFDSDFNYIPWGKDEDEIRITTLNDWATTLDIVIPATLEWRAGESLSVTSIGIRAFSESKLNSVDLSNAINLIEIQASAFSNNNLTTINIPNSITTIGWSGFDSNNINDLTFEPGSKLTTIAGYAFQNNDLTTINIPSSVTTIEPWAFAWNRLANLVIPSSVITIGDLAFHSQNDITTGIVVKFLTSLSFEPGSKLISIGVKAFSNNALTSLDLLANTSLTTIGVDAFDSNNLINIKIPNSVTTIGDSAFRRNKFSNLSDIILPTEFDSDAERTRIGIIVNKRY